MGPHPDHSIYTSERNNKIGQQLLEISRNIKYKKRPIEKLPRFLKSIKN